MLRSEKSESGSVAVVFAVVLVPLLMCVGFAVDYSSALSRRQRALQDADAAALAGARAAIEAIQSQKSSETWKHAAEVAAMGVYAARQARGKATNPVAITTVDTRMDGDRVVVSLDIAGAAATSFMQVVGVKSIPLSGSVQASANTPKYIQVNFIVDNSGSMGIGATANDQQLVYNSTGCTIACHYNDVYGGKDNVAIARGAGATLRMDVVKKAAAQIVQNLKASVDVLSEIEVGVYTMSNRLMQVLPPTDNLDSAITTLNAIDLSNVGQTGGTNIDFSLKQFAQGAAQSGDGSSPSKRRIFTVLLTDGLEDSAYEVPYGTVYNPVMDPNFVQNSPSSSFSTFEILQPPHAASCDPVKALGHDLLVMNLEYLVPTIEWWQSRFQAIKTQLKPEITPNLQACASRPNYLFNASTPSEIQAASDLVSRAIAVPNVRLSQ